jgi:hypothetical protein
MDRIVEAWGEHLCAAVAAFIVPASLQCSDVPLHYVGFGAMALLVTFVLWMGFRVVSR